jgi:hypothetical protein
MTYGLVVPSASETLLLQYILHTISADDPVLWLYSNNIIPSSTSVLSDFIAIPSTNIVLDPLTWIFTNGSAEYPTHIYTLSPGTTVCGYYVTNNAGTSLLWAQRCFFAPVSITVAANVFSVTPRFNAQSVN